MNPAAVIEALIKIAEAVGLTVIRVAQGRAVIISRIEPLDPALDAARQEAEAKLAERFQPPRLPPDVPAEPAEPADR